MTGGTTLAVLGLPPVIAVDAALAAFPLAIVTRLG
jgi:hypothetical protein